MDHTDRHQKIYKKRRRTKERLLGDPLYKRVLKSFETLARSLSINLFRVMLGVRPMKLPLDFDTIKSVLIIRNDAIGDMVLSTPLWHVIKQRFPHITIGVVGSFRNLSVIEQDPSVDLRFDCSLDDFKHIRNARREVRKHSWDLVLPLIYSKKTKMSVLAHQLAPKTPVSMILMFADPSDRYQKLFEGVVRSPVEISKTTMTELIKNHLALTAGIEISNEEWQQHLYPRQESLDRMHTALAKIMEEDGTIGCIHVNLEAKNAEREYGLPGSYEVSRKLTEQMPKHSIIWTSSPVSSKAALEYLRAHPANHIHFVPTQNIHDLIAIVRFCDMVITPDTSVIHIAAAERKPVVGLYPRVSEWPPLNVPAILLTPVYGDPLATIPVDWVVDSALELLNSATTEHPEIRWRHMESVS